jgi:hypothetical protein
MWKNMGDRSSQYREHPRVLPVLLLALAAFTLVGSAAGDDASQPLTQESRQVIVYQYFIVAGVIAMIAVLVPLHALLPHNGRVLWHAVALVAALASGISSIIGATFANRIQPNNGTLWQTVGTAVFMLFLAFLIQVQVVGGWNLIRQRARLPGRIVLATLEGHHWRDNVSAEQYENLVTTSGVGRNLLRFGSEPDQDAAVSAALLTLRRWAAASSETTSTASGRSSVSSGRSRGERELVDDDVRGDDVVCAPADLTGRSYPLHEPNGLVLLGSVSHAPLWLEVLLESIRRQPRSSLALAHHACVVLWWVGMICGALSKTGFNARADAWDMRQSVRNLRTAGIWIQTVLLVIGMYAFPYTRSIARYGTRVWPRMAVLVTQSVASFAIGIALLVVVHERKRNQNLIAYAVALMASATACALWCLVSVNAYQQAIRLLLGRSPMYKRNAMAFLTAIVTRPRHGYQGNTPVLRWGDLDNTGHAALEVPLEKEVEASFDEGLEDRLMDDDAGSEWRSLEAAAKGKSPVRDGSKAG